MTKRRGFAALSPQRRRQIAQAGGRAVHKGGRAHQWTSEEAKVQRQRQLAKQREMEEEVCRLRRQLVSTPSPGGTPLPQEEEGE